MSTPTALRIGLAAVALLALTSCTSDADWTASGLGVPTASEEATTTTTPPQWLFAVQSDGETSFDASTGQLSMPAGSVHAFTDRPYRDTKVTSPQAFVNLWQSTDPDSFEEDPPNAVLTYWDETGASAVPKTVVCEITGDVGYASADQRLSMGLRVLEPKGAVLPARMSRASLFVDDVAASPCVNSPEDESNIEYFNLLNFEGLINLDVQYVQSSDSYEVGLTCPDRPSPSIPSPGFDIQLATADQSSVVSCYSGEPITIPKQSLPQLPYCDANDRCKFEITALNTQTQTQYSVTELQVLLQNDENVLPQLEPATLQICSNTLSNDLTGPDPSPGTLKLDDAPS